MFVLLTIGFSTRVVYWLCSCLGKYVHSLTYQASGSHAAHANLDVEDPVLSHCFFGNRAKVYCFKEEHLLT